MNQVSAFTTKYPQVVNKILTEVVFAANNKIGKGIALWDTGATNSCISHEIVEMLNLQPIGMSNIQTPSGTSEVNIFLINIVLPNNVLVKDIRVSETEIGNQGIQALIGMDIIQYGDFCISNKDNHTTFSFRIPSCESIDFVKINENYTHPDSEEVAATLE